MMIEFWQLISPYILPLYYLFIFFVVVDIILDNRNPLKTHSYLLLLVLLPILGLVVYLFFGQNIRKKKIIARRQFINRAYGEGYLTHRIKKKYPLESLQDKSLQPFERLIRFLNKDLSPFTVNNHVTILRNGEEKFPALLEALNKAKYHIHLEYYIFEIDAIGNQVAEVLMEKARSGVKVRMLVDGVGALGLKNSFFREMKKAGVEIAEFMPVLFPSFTSKINYRDHRKIVVIDGDIGFTGGMNISERYLNGPKTDPYWRDTHLLMRGESVKALQFLFMLNWQFVTQQELPEDKYLFPVMAQSGAHKVQVNGSGPHWELSSIMDTFLLAINAARNRIRIATPYFIPNESILNALYTAAKSDVKVELMIPRDSDSWIVHAASFSFLQNLLKEGVEVYLYKKGFLHSKVIIIDDVFASVGSANMDYRSFDLNHEVNTYLYDEGLVSILNEHFEADMQDAEPLTLQRWRQRKLPQKLKESVCRLMAPLL